MTQNLDHRRKHITIIPVVEELMVVEKRLFSSTNPHPSDRDVGRRFGACRLEKANGDR
jgi:hypothetical protein